MATPLENVLNRLGKYKRVGKEYRTNCPGPNHANGDQHPSLDIRELSNGTVVFNCRSGHCRTEDIVANIYGVEMKDLFPLPIKTNGGSHFTTAEVLGRTSLTQHYKRFPNATQIEKAIVEPDQWDSLIESGADVKQQKVDWLVKDLVPRGFLTGVIGNEGDGKSSVLNAIGASLTRGSGFSFLVDPGEREPVNVLFWATEGSQAHVDAPRLTQMGADMSRVTFVKDSWALDEDEGLRKFSYVMSKVRPAFLVIDPVFNIVGRVNTNSDSESRSILTPLQNLATKYECGSVFVRHTNKSKGMGEVRNAGMGSVAWRAVPRVELLVACDPENPQVRAIRQTKNNLGLKCQKSFGFRIDHDGFSWTGESKLSEAAMLSFKTQETHIERSQREEAREFLKEILRGRPMAQKEIMKEAREAGLSETTVNRAKYDLGIKPNKVGLGHWEWSLP